MIISMLTYEFHTEQIHIIRKKINRQSFGYYEFISAGYSI